MPKIAKNLEFQISSLRQDKLIFAAEAVAINITCLVVSSLFGLVVNLGIIPEMYLFYTNIGIFVLGIAYTIYALIGNLSRVKQIKLLEQEL
jgi:hypothetical protein